VKNFVTREFYLSSTILESVLLVNVMWYIGVRKPNRRCDVGYYNVCSSIQKSSKK